MNDFRTENGTPTTRTDPLRLLWYSASCGYWTDDWSKVKKTGPGIPCCPECGCVGYQITAQKWFDGARGYEAAGHPRYTEFLNENREKCFGKNFGFEKQYLKWMEDQIG